MESSLIDQLKSVELLKNVPDQQLYWLIDRSDIQEAREGEFLYLPGNPIDSTIILLSGSYRVYMRSDIQEIDLGTNEKGAITGYLPFSRAKLSSGYGRFLEDSRILRLSKSFEREMIRDHYELTQALVVAMTTRVQASIMVRPIPRQPFAPIKMWSWWEEATQPGRQPFTSANLREKLKF